MTEPSEPREEGHPENAPDAEPNAQPASPSEGASSAPTPVQEAPEGAGPSGPGETPAPDTKRDPSDEPSAAPGTSSEGGQPAPQEQPDATPVAQAGPSAEGQPTGEKAPEAPDGTTGEVEHAGEGKGMGQPEAGATPPKKKRRRKKRKKKGASEGQGDDKSGSLPFMSYFGGAEGRKHAFSVGEVVAGRVARVAHGTFVVDLFGKAEAIADEHEPHEVPVQPAPAEGAPGASTEGGAVAAAAGEQTGVVPGADAPTGAHTAPLTATAAEKAEVAQPQPPAPVEEPEATAGGQVPGTDAPTSVAAGSGEPSPSPGESAASPTSPSDPAHAPAGQAPDASPTAGQEPDQTGEKADAGLVAGTVSAPAEHAAPLTATVAEKAEVAQPQPAAPGGAAAPAAQEATAEQQASTEPGEAQPPAEPIPEVPLEPEGAEPPSPGSIFRGRVGAVAESGHIALINRLVDRDAVKATIAKAQEDKRRVPGIVFGFNRGGFDVIVGGVRAFCPASGMSLDSIADPHTFVGRKLEFTLPPNKGGGGIIVSRRSILEREQRKRAKQRIKAIKPGHRMVGHVTSVRDFGAFVDLGEGLEGMVHVSELSWQRDARPQDVVRVGDEVVVRVLDVKPGSRKERHGRVSLSMRAVEPDPWDAYADKLVQGTPQRGRVVRTTDFGAFVELAPGIDGLLHISELGKDLSHASQAIKEGEELDVVIDRVDRKQRRISLSKLTPMERELVEKGELDLSKRPRSLKPGSHITVLVDRVEHAGVLVKVQGVLGKRGRGFIPNRELQSPEGGVDRKALQTGHPLDVKIIGTDRDGGLRCSVRGRHLDEERKAVQEYRKEASKKGLGTFGDLLRAKLEQDGSSDGN